MESQSCPFTEHILLYVIGECGRDEAEFLSKHLQTCPICREEAEQLQQTWQMLPFDTDEVEPPADLKQEVMEAIFSPHQSKAVESARAQRRGYFKWPAFSLQPWLTGVLLVALSLSLWNNWVLHRQLQVAETAASAPTKVLQAFALKSFDPAMSAAKGEAWLYQQGEKRQLVFHLQGLDNLQASEAYQIWLIHDGKRSSCGVFQVDPQGNGVLTYELTEDDPPFEGIGITLEPDPNGTSPRGKKVLGT